LILLSPPIAVTAGMNPYPLPPDTNLFIFIYLFFLRQDIVEFSRLISQSLWFSLQVAGTPGACHWAWFIWGILMLL
jgi:hypothetical protein